MTDTGIELEEIEDALHRGEFCFYYQPKVSFVTGQIICATGDPGELPWD